jgi:hypothetical protein
MTSWMRTAALFAAGAVGVWVALRALVPRESAPSQHAIDTWEGEGGNPAPESDRVNRGTSHS